MCCLKFIMQITMDRQSKTAIKTQYIHNTEFKYRMYFTSRVAEIDIQKKKKERKWVKRVAAKARATYRVFVTSRSVWTIPSLLLGCSRGLRSRLQKSSLLQHSMTKVVFRESLVMQKMRGSGCDGGRCLSTHLQADFAPVSKNEVRSIRDSAHDAFASRHEISREFVSCGFKAKTQMGIRSLGSMTKRN